MHGDEVGAREHVFHTLEKLNTQLVGALGAAIRVVPDDLHAEGARTLGHKPADAA